MRHYNSTRNQVSGIQAVSFLLNHLDPFPHGLLKMITAHILLSSGSQSLKPTGVVSNHF